MREAIKEDPEWGPTYDHLGRVLSLTNRHDEAIEAYEKPLSLAPDNPLANVNYGIALALQRGQTERALPFLRAAEKRFPDSDRLHNALGAALAMLKRHDEQNITLKKLFDQGILVQNIYLSLGYLYSVQGRWN